MPRSHDGGDASAFHSNGPDFKQRPQQSFTIPVAFCVRADSVEK